MVLKTQRCSGPVRCCATHGFDDPCRKVGKVLGYTPVAGCGSLVHPGELSETFPLVIDEVLVLMAGAGLENNDVDALLCKLVAERSAAGARADDDDHTVVLEIIGCSHGFLPLA